MIWSLFLRFLNQLLTTMVSVEEVSLFSPNVTGQRPGPMWVCAGPAVVCGLLTSCREDFTP